MKKLVYFLTVVVIFVFSSSCKKDSADTNPPSSTIGGEISPMAAIGTTVTSSSAPISGVSEFSASVVSLSGGISSYTGRAIVTNTTIKNLLANIQDCTVDGDTVSVTGFRIKQTVEGIESASNLGPGIIAKYSSNVGDTYPVGSTGRTRTVTNKSTTDDYSYGFYMIKVMKIEEPTSSKSAGLVKVTYMTNHRFGLVGVQYHFSDGTSATFPVYSSTSNSK